MKKLVFVFAAMFAVSIASCDNKKAAEETEAAEVVADTLAVDSVDVIVADSVVEEAEAVVAEAE